MFHHNPCLGKSGSPWPIFSNFNRFQFSLMPRDVARGGACERRLGSRTCAQLVQAPPGVRALRVFVRRRYSRSPRRIIYAERAARHAKAAPCGGKRRRPHCRDSSWKKPAPGRLPALRARGRRCDSCAYARSHHIAGAIGGGCAEAAVETIRISACDRAAPPSLRLPFRPASSSCSTSCTTGPVAGPYSSPTSKISSLVEVVRCAMP